MTRLALRRTVALVIAGLFVPAAVVMACTAFLATGDDGVLFGNNEDFTNPATKMWFIPGENEGYGVVYFGFDEIMAQGGMNEAGLAFDGFATQPKPVTGSGDKESYDGNLVHKVMTKCATVDEVLEVFAQYNLEYMKTFMFMFADAKGNSVIIEGDKVIRKNGPFQVVTNFYQSDDPTGQTAYGEGKVCARFEIANDLLKGVQRVNISDARKVLNATHMEGKSQTLYSMVYDLDDRLVYLYNFHDFENEVVIDLREELKKGAQLVDLSSLFPRNFARETYVTELDRELGKLREQRGSAEVPVETLKRFEGRYRGTSGEFEIRMEDDQLIFASDYWAFKLTPVSETELYDVNYIMELDIAFRFSANGTVDGADTKWSKMGYTFLEDHLEKLD